VPYRVDIRAADSTAADRLIDLGALDVEAVDGGVAALMPDRVSPDEIARAIGVHDLAVSAAVGRDAGSVWRLRPGAIRIGRIRLRPIAMGREPGSLALIDSPVFGTGLHPTTALCLEAIDEIVESDPPSDVLDVGTGSGVLALAALSLGVPRATGIDLDPDALRVAAENARLNGLDDRLRLSAGSAGSLEGAWPLVVANVLAAPLVEMAPVLVRRAGRHARLVLSGISESLEEDVARADRHVGLRHLATKKRDGWIALVMRVPW
jgi:ribosomal protein L11 methylase PrmA